MRLGVALLLAALAAADSGQAALPARSRVRRLEAAPLPPGLKGRPLAKVDLARLLDAAPSAELELEGRRWRLSLGADAEFRRFFAIFSDGRRSRVFPISPPRGLTHGGLVLALDDRTSYRFRVKPRRRSPVRESRVTAETPDDGPVASWTSGELIDALAKAASRLSTEEGALLLAYVSDRDASTGATTGTRSLLFFEPHRFLPKAWRLPAAEADERGVVVKVGRSRLSLKLARGQLVVEELL